MNRLESYLIILLLISSQAFGDGMTSLMLAGTPDKVNALLENGAELNETDSRGATALHYAVSTDRAEEIIPLLLKAGAEVNVAAKGMNGETPFLTARQLFNEKNDFTRAANIVRMLYRAGASVDAQDSEGYTALMTAAVNNNPRMARFMLLLGADVDIKSVEGKTALDYAEELGHEDITKIIVNSPF